MSSPRRSTRPKHAAAPLEGGEAAGLRTPAASHLPLPLFGYVRWVKFKLFGMLGLTIAFVIVQTIWLAVAMKKNESVDQQSES